jgi:hypothetical protein
MRGRSSPRSWFNLEFTYEFDDCAALNILTFLAKHHRRAQDEVVREVLESLPAICGLLGAGQGSEQEVGNL